MSNEIRFFFHNGHVFVDLTRSYLTMHVDHTTAFMFAEQFAKTARLAVKEYGEHGISGRRINFRITPMNIANATFRVRPGTAHVEINWGVPVQLIRVPPEKAIEFAEALVHVGKIAEQKARGKVGMTKKEVDVLEEKILAPSNGHRLIQS